MADLPDLLASLLSDLFPTPGDGNGPLGWPPSLEVAGVNSIIIITAVIQFSELPCVFFASAGRRDGEGDRVTLDLSRLSLPYNIPWSVTAAAAAVDRYRRRREEVVIFLSVVVAVSLPISLSLPFCRLASHHHANSINNNSRADSLGQSRS